MLTGGQEASVILLRLADHLPPDCTARTWGPALNGSLDRTILNERASVDAARRGDVQAFNELVERYQRLAYNVAYRTLGQADEAADATQDAFLSAFRAINEFRGQSFKAWLLRIVVNSCYDELRRRRRRPADSLEAMAERAEGTTAAERASTDSNAGPEMTALRSETAEVIQRVLDSLPSDQRFVVTLCDVQGLSYEEAASALGLAVGTVKSRLSRARVLLRDQLVARGELPAVTRRLTGEDVAAT
jgi:RNA polymerase sigma-70 factor (ECF subfamily)